MSDGTLDIDRLADLLSSIDDMDNIDVALGLADIGVLVLPTVPGSKNPMLTRLHIDGTDKAAKVVGEPCEICRSAQLTAAGDHGATIDPDIIHRYWSAHPDAGVGMKNHPQLVRGDADYATVKEAEASYTAIGYDNEPEPFIARTPGGPLRRRYLHTVPEGVPAPGGGTGIAGVAWYGSSGYVVVKGRHPDGLDYPQFDLGGKSITPLPKNVIAGLADYKAGVKSAGPVSTAEVDEWLKGGRSATSGKLSLKLDMHIGKFHNYPAGRHPWLLKACHLIVGWELVNRREVFDRIQSAWDAGMASSTVGETVGREGEPVEVLASCIGHQSKQTDGGAGSLEEWTKNHPLDSDLSELRKGEPIHMPLDFWELHPTLTYIRDVALSRLRSPDAVFGGVLARRASQLRPIHQLAPIIGSAGSLNLVVGFVAFAGGGKTSTHNLCVDLVPLDDQAFTKSGLPIGSGEGLGEAFYDEVDVEGKRGKIKQRQCGPTHGGTWSVNYYVDEGEAIASLAKRDGTTTSSALRKAWSGSTLGETNASSDTARFVPAHKYRFTMIASFQYSNAADIVKDSDTGTAQRFLWVGTQHPSITGDVETIIDIEPLGLQSPTGAALDELLGGPQYLRVSPAIEHEMKMAEAAEMNGGSNVAALDSHRRMMKLKVSAILQSILTPDDLTTITDQAWEMAETVLATSDKHRELIVRHHDETGGAAQDAANVRAGDRAAVMARRTAETNDEIRAAKVTDAAIRIRQKVGEGIDTTRQLKRLLARFDKDIVDAAFDHAESERWIVTGEVKTAAGGTPKKSIRPGPVDPPR